jgi:DNA-binding CsgD family transcriptional regulator
MPAIAMAVFDLIDRLAAAPTVSQVWAAYLEAARKAGFDHGLAFFADQSETSLAKRSFGNGMPAGWLNAYSAAGCEISDPIAARLPAMTGPYRWRLDDLPAEPCHRKWRDLLDSAGLKAGIIMPERTSTTLKVVGLCGRDIQIHPHDRMALHLAAFEFLHRADSLGIHPPIHASGLRLSERECECLKWIAAGKTDWEIGHILSISEKTVGVYVQRAKNKLRTQTRPQTIMAAIRQGFINL